MGIVNYDWHILPFFFACYILFTNVFLKWDFDFIVTEIRV